MKTPNSRNNLVYSYKFLYYKNCLDTEEKKQTNKKVYKRIILLSSEKKKQHKTKQKKTLSLNVYWWYNINEIKLNISEHENA